MAKWQTALNLWDSWRLSVDQVRNELLSKYGGIRRLTSRTRKEDEFLSDLLDEIPDIYERIIAKDIGLKPDSSYYDDFLYTWMHYILPEVIDEYIPDYDLSQLTNKNQQNIWHSYDVENRQGRFVAIYSVNWIPGKVNMNDIITKIQDMEWPSPARIIRIKKGGRPSEEDKQNLEAITCALLKDKQRLTHIEIGRYFDWAIEPNEWGKPKTSQTSMNRVKLGRKLIKSLASK